MVSFFVPEWDLPSGVGAAITTSEQGDSEAAFAHFNLAQHVGDDAVRVNANRKALIAACEGLERIQWLDQVHGTDCVSAGDDSVPRADAAITDRRGLGCCVLTADCLPVLFCTQDGSQVAAAHAGWRGLASGVLASVVSQFRCDPAQIKAYLGPAIGPAAFEVGLEVVEAFYESARSIEQIEAVSQAITPSSKPLKFYLDLYVLARAELRTLGVSDIAGGDFCTFTDKQRFYSYRRSTKTGRMASLIWRKN